MNKPSQDKARLDAAVESAESAFWADVAANYPEAKTGDFSPEAAIALDGVLHKAIALWLEWNADPQESEIKTTEIMLHRIEYSYREWDSLTITDTDMEHIAYCIGEGISEGELNSEVPAVLPTEMVRGYWKINNCPDV